jgi:hypothetical protein
LHISFAETPPSIRHCYKTVCVSKTEHSEDQKKQQPQVRPTPGLCVAYAGSSFLAGSSKFPCLSSSCDPVTSAPAFRRLCPAVAQAYFVDGRLIRITGSRHSMMAVCRMRRRHGARRKLGSSNSSGVLIPSLYTGTWFSIPDVAGTEPRNRGATS